MTTNDSGPEPGTATADPQAPGAATAADGRTPRATWSLRLLGVALALLLRIHRQYGTLEEDELLERVRASG